MERDRRRVRDLTSASAWLRASAFCGDTQAWLRGSAFCRRSAMGGKGGRSGTGKAKAPRWASAVPGGSPWITWSPRDIPEWSGGMPEVEAVPLFPMTSDTPQGMEDRAQDSDEGKVTGEPME